MTATANLVRLATRLADLPGDAMPRVADTIRTIAEDEGRRAMAARFRLTTADDLTVTRGRATLIVTGTPRAPWKWATSGTRGHAIPRGGGREGQPRYLKAAGYPHPVRGPIRHPGSRGRGAWRRVQARAQADVPDMFVTAVRGVMNGA